MKLSRYNIKRTNDSEVVIYNMMSGGILKLENNFSTIIDDIFSNKLIFEKISNLELKNNLLKGSFFIDDDIDEVEYLKYISKISRNNSQVLSLTIAPTLNCNFDCPYCYEKGYRQNSMNDEIIESLINFIKEYKQHNNLKHLNIAWYGGEPLLGLDKINKIKKYIDEEILLNSEIVYNSYMITNGYLLNEEAIQNLINLNISGIQITLDGPKYIHNQRRYLTNKKGTYDKIIDNLVKINNRLNVAIRVNIDRDNEKESFKILKELNEKGLQDNIYIYTAMIDSINDKELEKSCLKKNEYSEFEIEFLKKASDMGFKCGNVPHLSAGICGAVNESSFVIDSHGDIHKCWNTVGQKEERVGNLLDNFKNLSHLLRWSNYNFLDDSECINCKVLPLCMGGCPHHNIKGHKACSPLKNNIGSIIDLNYNKYLNSIKS